MTWKLYQFSKTEMRKRECFICGKEMELGYSIGETKIHARILAVIGFHCGECIAKMICHEKFSLERK